MEPESLLRSLRAEADQLAAGADSLRASLDATSATATSPDGVVTVTLSATGALAGITFSAKAANVPPDALGPLVLRTAGAARQQLTDRISQFAPPSTLDFLNQLRPADPPPPPRRESDDEFGGVLRKRPRRS